MKGSAPVRAIESIAEATDLNPTRVYVQRAAGTRVHSFKASKLPAFPKVVKLLLRHIDLGYLVVYRGEILTTYRFLEVIETARDEARLAADLGIDAQDAA